MYTILIYVHVGLTDLEELLSFHDDFLSSSNLAEDGEAPTITAAWPRCCRASLEWHECAHLTDHRRYHAVTNNREQLSNSCSFVSQSSLAFVEIEYLAVPRRYHELKLQCNSCSVVSQIASERSQRINAYIQSNEIHLVCCRSCFLNSIRPPINSHRRRSLLKHLYQQHVAQYQSCSKLQAFRFRA